VPADKDAATQSRTGSSRERLGGMQKKTTSMINSTDTYKIFSDFYDLYVGKFSDDLDFYKTYCNSSDKIIEVGCGTGRILEFFLKQDYQIVGVDVSQEMLDKANEKLLKWINSDNLKLLNHDFTFHRFNDSFDKVLLTFYTFNYIIDKPSEFLHNIYDSLNDNGVLLLDLFYPTTFYDKTIDNIWIQKDFTVNGTLIKINDNRHVNDNIERRTQIFFINDNEIKIDTDRKYYSPTDIKGFLEKVGFKDIEVSLDYDLTGFSSMIDDRKLRKNYIVKATK
jgi:SAM-dependent methyltransferase